MTTDASTRSVGMVECWVEGRSLPALLANEHHVKPKEVGGGDDKANLKWLCPTCHQNLHRFADMLLAGKPAQASDTANIAYPNPEQRQKVMWLAGEAAKYIRAFDEATPLAARKDVSVTFDCDSADYMKLKAIAADMRTGNRKASVPAVVRYIVASFLSKRGNGQPR